MAQRRRSRRKIRRPAILILSVFCLFMIMVIALRTRQSRIEQEEEVPVRSVLEQHDYNWDNLKWNGSFLSYEDENYTSLQGIDVSEHNGEIDWDEVKKAGVDFAFIRAGYRGYYYGLLHDDVCFDYNMQEAERVGIARGIYFYSQAVNAEEAREEADLVIAAARKYGTELPIVFDMEESDTGENGRILPLSREEKTEVAVTFLHRVQNAGYDAMIYNSSKLYEQLFVIEYLQEFEIWVADYYDYPQYPYVFSVWQYTSDGSVPGISNRTDMNIMFVKKDAD